MIKLDQSFITDLKKLRADYEKITVEFGELKMLRLKLNTDEAKRKEEFDKLYKLETDIETRIIAKYGHGTVNVDEGTFTKTK
jgi:hypothetical protein